MSSMEESTVVVAELSAKIGARVRQLRAAGRMSLDALAARSAVSRSMISLIERGESSASAVVLDKVATGLGVPLAALFDDSSAARSPVSRGIDRRTWRDPETGYTRRNISPPNFPSPLEIVDVELPPGARVAYETAARAVTLHQQIWVREGSIEVTVGEATHKLDADDCLAMRLDVPTAFRNRTRKPARYVVVIASERMRAARN